MNPKKFSLLNATLLFPLVIFAQGFDVRGGNGAVAITPRGFYGNNVSHVCTSDSFSIRKGTRALALNRAKEILQNTDVIMSPKVGEGGAISEQTLAFATLLHYTNKPTAKLKAQMIYKFARTDEGRVYGLMLLFCLSKNEYDSALKKINSNKEINTLFGGTLRRMSISEFFAAFNCDPSKFIPTSDVLNMPVCVDKSQSSPIYVNPTPRIFRRHHFRPYFHRPLYPPPPPPPPHSPKRH